MKWANAHANPQWTRDCYPRSVAKILVVLGVPFGTLDNVS